MELKKHNLDLGVFLTFELNANINMLTCSNTKYSLGWWEFHYFCGSWKATNKLTFSVHSYFILIHFINPHWEILVAATFEAPRDVEQGTVSSKAT